MIRTLFLAAFLALPACADQENKKVEGTTKDIQWGQPWAGPEVKGHADLKGKVVLLKIWGG